MDNSFIAKCIAAALLCTAALSTLAEKPGRGAMAKLDADGDKLISFDEFQMGGQRAESMLERADQDGDGAVTMAELEAARESFKQEREAEMKARRAEHEERMATRFADMDTDGDGAVTPLEAKQHAFSQMDADNDGFISQKEFRKARKNHRKMRPHHQPGEH